MKISCNVKQGTSLVKNSFTNSSNQRQKQMKKSHIQNKNISNHKLHGSNLDDSIKKFNNLISEAPIYMCSVCQQTQSNSSA